MEVRNGLTIFTDNDEEKHLWRNARVHGGLWVLPAIAPDGRAMCWGTETLSPANPQALSEEIHRLTVDSLSGGLRSMQLEMAVPALLAVSNDAQFLVAGDRGGEVNPQRKLLALDLRSGVVAQDLSSSLTQFPLAKLDSVNVSGSGTLVAVASWEQMQVLEIPTGKSVYAGPGFLPRLSPDGKRMAFVSKNRLYIRTLMDGSNVELLRGTRVKGVGGWSPDGRFLLAGAWTKPLAFEKRQIVIDTSTGSYGVLGTLQEGDFGEKPRWISSKLLAR
jgi:hypothetical protein